MALAPLGLSYTPIDVVTGGWRLAAGPAHLDLPVAFHVGVGPLATRPVSALREHGLLDVKVLNGTATRSTTS